VTGPEFISIPEWGRRLGISKDSAYKAARLGQIPGCFAIGRLYRVNWSAFVERRGLAGGQQAAEEVGGEMKNEIPPVGERKVSSWQSVVSRAACRVRPPDQKQADPLPSRSDSRFTSWLNPVGRRHHRL
jgi:hypothetical protein